VIVVTTDVVGGRSGIVAIVSLPARLRALRLQHHDDANKGIPPHVTLLYPFAPAGALTRPVRKALARAAAAHEPFVVAFPTVETFPSVVFLAPRPSAPFLDLTRDLCIAFPAYPPYGGEIATDDLIPHLTMAEESGDRAEVLVREIGPLLPVRAVIRSIAVITEDDRGRWSPHWRLRLGGGA